MNKNGEILQIDPATYEIVRHRLEAIAEEMGVTLKRVSVSPVITEVNDFSCAVFLADGSTVAQGPYVIQQVGMLSGIVRAVLKRCSENPGIGPDDMFIMNDPYLGGGPHQSDVAIVAPVHVDGELVGFVGTNAHQLDIGAMIPGGMTWGAREVYQEGLRLPPVKLVENGRLREDIFGAILNMIRMPDSVALDLKAAIAANNVARQQLRRLFAKYGPETMRTIMERMIAESEQALRRRLRGLPDGTFRHVDYIDSDGHGDEIYEVTLAMTKEDDSLVFDFTGTSEQSIGCVNCTVAGTWGGVTAALAPWLCYDIPWNAGIHRPLRLVVPEGTLLNAQVPAPVSAASIEGVWVAKNAAQVCLSKLMACSDELRDDAMAVWTGGAAFLVISGQDQGRRHFSYPIMDHIAGGCGARSFADGVGSAGDSNSPTLAIPDIETHEAFNPVLFLYRRELQDSGGPGKFRGGVSMEEALMPHDTDRLVLHFGAHGTEAPNSAGIFGGYPGCGPLYTVFRGTSVRDLLAAGEVPQSSEAVRGELTVQPARASGVTLEEDDVLAYYWSGGGGYGDPLNRDPEAVARDVTAGLVSDAVARHIYGVVLVSGAVSQAATEELRASLRRMRVAPSSGESADTREDLAGTAFRFRVGESLDVREKEGRDVFACRHCQLYLGDVTGNYKVHALMRDRGLEELGPPYPPKLRTRFVLREFSCPGCGTQLEVDLVRPSQPVLWDIELKDTRSVRSQS